MLAQKKVELIEKDFHTTIDMKNICRRVASEGCVLLKNNGSLPLKNKKVSVFGRCQIDTFSVGYGSGGAVKAPYKINFLDGLINNGANLYCELVNIYKAWCDANVPEEGEWGRWPTCFPEMPLTDEIVKEASINSDCALVVIGRSAGEDRDILKADGSWYLNDSERELLKLVTTYFNEVIVVINSGSIIDISEILFYNPNAILYVWQGGQEMGNGVADVLLGSVSPSGKLTDTLALIEDYPSTNHFGYPDENIYFEDIYVGYRYFNTFALDKIIYPFGYGLTYSKFNYKILSIDKFDNKITVSVSVKNIGNYAAKEVIQLYLSKPNGKFKNPRYELVSFKKTSLLNPNAIDILHLEFDISDSSVYDDFNNRYVLEDGVYKLYIGFDSINVEEIYNFTISEMIVVKESVEACAPIKSFTRMINNDGNVNYESVPLRKINQRERILNMLPEESITVDKWYSFKQVVDGEISLDEFVNSLSFDELEALTRGSLYSMNSPYGPFGNTGTFAASTDSLFKRCIPAISTNDGPSGVRMGCHSTLVPNGITIASTFNLDLVYDLAVELGKEVLERDSHVMLAPGLNIHRNPLCGRNFEYYSEDPYLTGILGAYYVKGIQDAGASACPKHFACNNQEYLRYNNDSILSARALREIYVKAFDICVKIGNPDVIMTSYNKVNGEFSFYNHDLVRVLLREEIGYKGLVITDWWFREGESNLFKDLKTQAYRIRATVDVYMPGSRGDRDNPGVSDGTLKFSLDKGAITSSEIKLSAKNVLKLCLKYYNEEKAGE